MAKPIPPIRRPTAGYVRVECSVDCASCGRRVMLDAKGPRMAEQNARARGWKIIRLLWFCPACVT
jgi:hypothetical protein